MKRRAEDSKFSSGRRVEARVLLLDESGREVDAAGNLVQWRADAQQIKTLAANVAVAHAQKKRENPYLSHRTQQPAVGAGEASVADGAAAVEFEDPRLAHLTASRGSKAKKSFQFVEAGTYVKEESKLRAKEERKVIGGYASGRRAPEVLDSLTSVKEETDARAGSRLAPADEGLVLPHTHVEWWDEPFLPKGTRDARRGSKAAQLLDHFHELALGNSKTHKYVQHPVAIRPLGGDRGDEPLPMFLTKREQKRVRKAAREAREQEKRDKMMMGLIAPAEPKFKLSNFMKILGDQAVADPSKVEQRVIQQVQKRLLDHEMRNLGSKLTPAERAEKLRRKLVEDTSRQVHVALFRVRDFSDRKHRFKVDVNAQQLNLSGIVLLCSDGGPAASSGANLVVVEGGPKGVRKFTHLMTSRIAWDDMVEPDSRPSAETSEHGEQQEEEEELKEEEEEEEEEDEEGAGGEGADGPLLGKDNRCDMLWRGILPKRMFQGFRFQECKSASTARKVLEAKGVAHYWDMAYRADALLLAGNI